MAILKLHHSAYRCRDSEATRRFYEDFLGLPLVTAFEIGESKTGRAVEALHTFYRLDDGSHLAFFEVPGMPFEFKAQHDYDLHIALEVEAPVLERMRDAGLARGVETRGISDHGSIRSVYFRDPDGYVVELCARSRASEQSPDGARQVLDRWTRARAAKYDAADAVVRQDP
jgi:catechol 2,3-dioxygenase-like lactoylglutathione lyase family enzyme